MEDTEDVGQQVPKPYVLRILSGPHQSAEVPLQEAPLTLGKGETSDIVLMDSELQEQHAQFFVRGRQCFCVPMSGAKIFVEQAFIDKETPLEDFDAIVCGTTLLSVGPQNIVWPTIEMPDMEETEESPEASEPQSEPVSVSEEGQPVPTETEPRVEERESQETPPEPQKETVEEKKPEEKKPDVESLAPQEDPSEKGFFKKYKKRIIIGLCGIIGIVVVGVSFLFFSVGKTAEEEASLEGAKFPIMSLKKSIEDVVEKQEIDPEFVKISLSGQKFVFQCYVKTSQEKMTLQKSLRALPKVVFQTIHIYVQKILIDQAQSLLSQYTLYVKPGKKLDTIMLTGYLYSIDQLSGIKNRILKDVPGINGIETTLLSPDEIYNLASNVLVQHDLMGLLKIQPVRTGLMISGHIQASQEPRWLSAQKTLKQTFNGICKVLTYVAVVAPQAVKNIFFPSPITTVSIPENEKPWIDLKNGDRYYEGALLPSSYYIQSISQEGIRLHKNDDSVFFALSEL